MIARVIDMTTWRERQEAKADTAATRALYAGRSRPPAARLTLDEIMGDRQFGDWL